MCFNAISNATFSTKVEVQDAVTALNVSSPSPKYILSGTTVHLYASMATGTNVIFFWDFASNVTVTTYVPVAMYTYTQTGVYLINVTAMNNVSSVLTSKEVNVQDHVGEVHLIVPNIITVNQDTIMAIVVTSGSELALKVFLNGTAAFNTTSYLPGETLEQTFVLTQTGELQILVQAKNQVSLRNISAAVVVVREIYMATIEPQQPPVLGEDIILVVKVNGYLHPNKMYIYNWTFPNNLTVVSGSPVISYRFVEVGSQLIDLLVSDLASNTSTQHLLNVSEVGKGPRLSHVATVTSGQPAVFTLKNISTDIQSLTFDFGDGNITYVSTTAKVNNSVGISHTYAFPGIYIINVTISGSDTNLPSVIAVQDLLKNMTLSGPDVLSLPAKELIPSVVTWNAQVECGSNCIYRWRYSDGITNTSLIGSDKVRAEETSFAL
ncbi:polycystin-1-like [Latimeria chalumnae]|uniref:polycystin-1-like n=1 Tax=Latimeria chalumnae TaxID=7897 RepID=UPI00313CCF29